MRSRLLKFLFLFVFTCALFELACFLLLWHSPSLRFRPFRGSFRYFKHERAPNALPQSLSALSLTSDAEKNVPAVDEATNPGEFLIYDKKLGLWLTPPNANFSQPFLGERSKKKYWETQVTTDVLGRRITSWQASRRSAPLHLLALGCSMTWGEGASDDEALPAQLALRRKDLRPLNAGVPGYGPGEVLVRARDTALLNDLKGQAGIGIYFLIHDHYSRFFNGTRALTWRPQGLVMREQSEGQFIAVGKLNEISPWRVSLARFLAVDPIARIFNLDFPLVSEAGLDEMFRAIKDIRNVYRQKTDSRNPFVVVILPGERDDRFYRSLAKTDLTFLDYSRVSLDSLSAGPTELPGNAHPVPEVYSRIAQALEKDLGPLLDARKREIKKSP